MEFSANPGYQNAPQRECGTCTLCCKVYNVPELDKPPGVWCRNCIQSGGCRIYPTRPTVCREFLCLWRTDGSIRDEWKPERSKMVLTVTAENGYICVQVDPGYPQAWRKSPYHEQLRRWAKEFIALERHVVVYHNFNATLIMPEETIPMGVMNPTDQFRIRKSYGPTGAIYSVEKD